MAATSWSAILSMLCSMHADRVQIERGRRCDERGRVDCRHPDSRLVNLEQVSDQGVEVDVGVGKVEKCELLPVPRRSQLLHSPFDS